MKRILRECWLASSACIWQTPCDQCTVHMANCWKDIDSSYYNNRHVFILLTFPYVLQLHFKKNSEITFKYTRNKTWPTISTFHKHLASLCGNTISKYKVYFLKGISTGHENLFHCKTFRSKYSFFNECNIFHAVLIIHITYIIKNKKTDWLVTS